MAPLANLSINCSCVSVLLVSRPFVLIRFELHHWFKDKLKDETNNTVVFKRYAAITTSAKTLVMFYLQILISLKETTLLIIMLIQSLNDHWLIKRLKSLRNL